MHVLQCIRTVCISSILLMAATACGGANTGSDPGSAGSGSETKLQLQDIVIGDPNAPLTLIEYASWTCGACLDFHTRIMPTIKADYIDTGKINLVFREFPTAPANLSVAGFVLARCAGEAAYSDVVDELFSRQAAFITLARNGDQVTEALKQVGANHGVSGEGAYEACMQDKANRDAIRASIAAARAKDVTATPTFVMNGEIVPISTHLSAETFSAYLDSALAQSNP